MVDLGVPLRISCTIRVVAAVELLVQTSIVHRNGVEVLEAAVGIAVAGCELGCSGALERLVGFDFVAAAVVATNGVALALDVVSAGPGTKDVVEKELPMLHSCSP